jgi:hypothetical protein
MDATPEKLTASISELEDQYAELLTRDASERELATLWASIRQLRQDLKKTRSVIKA